MGDVRYTHSYEKVRHATDRARAVQGLADEDLIAALAVAASERDDLLANVLATEAQNRVVRFQRLLDAMADAVLVLEAPELRVLSGNAAVAKLFGFAPEDLRGKTTDRLHVGGRTKAFYVERVERALAREETERFELAMRRADGRSVDTEHTVAPVLSPMGEVTGAVDIVRDVSERKLWERREGAQHEIARLLAEGRAFRETAPAVLRVLAGIFGADMCELWRFGPHRRALQLSANWHADDARLDEFHRESRPLRFEIGEGLPGTVARMREARWLNGIGLNPEFTRHRIAAKAGLSFAVGAPIRSGEDLLGAFLLLGRDMPEPDPVMVEVLDIVGRLIAAYLERRTLLERYQGLLESAPDAISIAEEDGSVLVVNRRFEAMLGVSAEDAAGSDLLQWLAEPDRAAFRAAADRVEVRGSALALSAHGKRKDGSTFPLEATLSRLDSEEGQLLVASLRDASERIEAERALRESERRYRLLAETASDVVTTCAADGSLVYVSPVARRVLGHDPVALLGKPLWEISRAADRQDLRAAHLTLLQTGGPVTTAHRVVAADGRELAIETSSRAVLDADGSVREIVSISRDVTERRRAEDLFRALLEAAPDAMIVVGGDGIIQLVNARAEQLFGYSRRELVGRPIEILVPERFWARHVEERRGYALHPRTRPMGVGLELYGRRRDGSEFPVEISLSPVTTLEGTLVTASIRDATERAPRPGS